MIEVIYKDESQDAKSGEEPFGLPRNIRQIGLVRDDYKIYMEDYVYTFLVRLARSENVSGETKAQVAVLTGEIKWRSQTAYLFIKGAMMAEDMDAAPDHIDFSGEQWKKIQKEQEKYFAEQEIVGWFFSQPQLVLEVSELMTKIHMKHFGGEKVLMLMEPQEREDAFFHYENNEMVHLGGYYLYYEKNPSMQTYMIDKNKELQPEVQEHYEDQAVKDFRKIITDKKETKKESAAPSVFSYGLTACLAIAVLSVGVNFYRGYQKTTQPGTDAATVSSVIVEEVTPSPTARAEETVTPTIREEISPTPMAAKKVGTETKSDKTEQVPAAKVENTESADKTEQIYQQEADERKAKKRVREAAEKENREAASGTTHESYVIQPGDTLFQICMDRYGSAEAISQICQLNGISADEIIYPGQVIVLP
ncbi:LysM peptidoglycan-binding domain-containing protein [Blautia sp.]